MYDDLTSLVEEDIGRLSKAAARMLGRLAVAGNTTNAARYQALVREMTEIRDLWLHHIETASSVFPVVLFHDRHIARFLHQFETDQTEVRRLLDGISTAAWPRSVQSGITAVRFRATETLTLMLRQLETERITVLPLVRRRLAAAVHRTESVVPRYVTAKTA